MTRKGYRLRPMIAALVNAVKELNAENEDLRTRLEDLEQAVDLNPHSRHLVL